MRKLVFIFGLLLFTVAITQAKQITEERAVADFTGVASGGYFDVYITLGDKESLRLEGDAELLKDIETKIEKGVLKIRNKDKKRYWDWNSSDRSTVKIYITAKTLTNVSMSGSGHMKVAGTIKSPDFRVNLSGSGSLVVAAEAVNVFATLSGSGNMKLSGLAQTTDLTVSGSGNVNASEFKSKNANAVVSGSGNASLAVEQNLKATLSGSGNIRYSGNPSITETKNGSGKIAKM